MILRKVAGNRFIPHVAIFLISFLILLSRRPDAVFNPQFWAEDGKVWYAQAYNNGLLNSLFLPEGGYFQTLSRAVACAGQFIPFIYTPLLFNLVALVIKALFVNVLVSERCRKLIPNYAARLFVAFIYLALPNSYETHANLTNAQWNLALLACLILLATPSEKTGWKIFDVCVIVFSALSGPFCIFLLPIAVILVWKRKDSWTRKLFYLLLAGAIVQIFSLTLLTGFSRPSRIVLGASAGLFFKIIGGQIFFASLTGLSGYSYLNNHYGWTPTCGIVMTIIGLIPILHSVWKADLELKLYLLFGALITCGALLFPALNTENSQWLELWLPFAGNRYWLIPGFGFILSIIFTAVNGVNWYLRGVAFLLFLILPLGIYKDWNYAPYTDYDFPAQVKRFEETPSQTQVVIPINPNWEMKLLKK